MYTKRSAIIELFIVATIVWTVLIWGAVVGHKKLDHWIHQTFPVETGAKR